MVDDSGPVSYLPSTEVSVKAGRAKKRHRQGVKRRYTHRLLYYQSLFARRTASVLRGMAQIFSEILVHINMTISYKWCRFAIFITSQRCSNGLRSADWGSHHTLNPLSWSWTHLEMTCALWYFTLSCWWKSRWRDEHVSSIKICSIKLYRYEGYQCVPNHYTITTITPLHHHHQVTQGSWFMQLVPNSDLNVVNETDLTFWGVFLVVSHLVCVSFFFFIMFHILYCVYWI